MEVEKSDIEWFLVFLTGFISLLLQIKAMPKAKQKPRKQRNRKSKKHKR